METYPDVLAKTLTEANQTLQSAGILVEVMEISQGVRKAVEGPFRVIRQQIKDDKILITVCRVPE